jgi:mRNA interferase MazF
MPSFSQGDVIRVPFPYTDRPARQRPALVVSNGGIAMITSAENRAWPGDVPFGDFNHEAGLPAPSVIRPCKIATIEVRHAKPLGHISPTLMRQVVKTLRKYLGFRS